MILLLKKYLGMIVTVLASDWKVRCFTVEIQDPLPVLYYLVTTVHYRYWTTHYDTYLVLASWTTTICTSAATPNSATYTTTFSKHLC